MICNILRITPYDMKYMIGNTPPQHKSSPTYRSENFSSCTGGKSGSEMLKGASLV